ncbi:MAG: O-antigen ligase family protein [Caldilineaceae bacterium]
MVALVALWHYGSDTMLIQAEGVQRVRAFYGSPNNLALYVERTFAVVLALALFTKQAKWRLLWVATTLIQGATLILTFSKGALLLGLPMSFAVLWIGGYLLLGQRGGARRVLWWLAGAAALALLALLPFLATERFQRLLNFEQGTGFVRLQLWRSSWQMAVDHPWFGVGPDNFLCAYRSHYLLPAAWQEPNLNHPHNWPLDWWTRIGVPGLLLAITWLGLLLWRQWHQLRGGAQPVLALGLLAATAGALTHGLIDASYALPDLMLVWVLISHLLVRK